MRKSPSHIAFMLLTLLPALASAQNLVQNGSFDSDLSGWTIGGGAQGTISHAPAESVGGAGAAGFAGVACCTVSMAQCVVLPPGGEFEVGAFSRRDSATPPETGDGIGFDVFWHSTADCSALIQNSVVELADVTAWSRQIEQVSAPPGAISALVRVRQYNFAGLADLRTLVDDVVFGPAGTVPVELQRFEVE